MRALARDSVLFLGAIIIGIGALATAGAALGYHVPPWPPYEVAGDYYRFRVEQLTADKRRLERAQKDIEVRQLKEGDPRIKALLRDQWMSLGADIDRAARQIDAYRSKAR